MIKVISALALVVFSTHALANQEEAKALKASSELTAIEALIGKDLKLARAYMQAYQDEKMKVVPVENDNYVQSVMDSYAYGDINGDGIKDLAVVVETAPTTQKDGYMSYGKRSLRLYIGDRNGKQTLLARNVNAVLTGDEGGVMGDPFMGVEINPRGVVIVNHYGGSAQKWGITQKFQMRKGEVFLIGMTNVNYDGITGKQETEDINLITGDKVVTWLQIEEDKPAKIKKSKVPVKPLVKFVNSKVVDDL